MKRPVPAPAPIGRRIVSGVAGALAAAMLAWGAWLGYAAVVAHPVERVVYAGDLDRLAQEELDALAQAIRAAPAAPIDAIRGSARKVPWVREATVRRLFPDAVEIDFVAYTAFARWNDAALVSREGEVFAAPGAGPLPQLRGPEGTAPQVVREYIEAAAILAPVGGLAEFRLSPRGAWFAILDSGLSVALGRGEWRPRAHRFVAAWPKLPGEARASSHADLRYPAGFALERAATLTLAPTARQAPGSTP